MRRLAAAAFVLTLAGCGSQAQPTVLAFELGWPHGVTRGEQHLEVAGKVAAVYVGRVRLGHDWTCLGSESAARWRDQVTVELDDATTRCSGPRLVPIVGQTPFEWSPGAIVVR